ncbi:hypothetical protein [Planctomycetes bacterium TBK1r]|uniref:hypothetical protein n=1 Tax=Stieleria magnilauensis TaxID=2527963 RepID=UPI0011A34639
MRHFDESEVLAAIKGTGGILRSIAANLGCDRTTIGRWRDRSKVVADAIEDERQSSLDAAESQLIGAVNAGDSWAIKFFLSTQGRNRGYDSRAKEPPDTLSSQVAIYLPDNGRGLPDAAGKEVRAEQTAIE